MTELTQQLHQLIERTGALQTGHFQLASGLHSQRFFRCIKLFQSPRSVELIFDAIADPWRDRTITHVLGANEAGSILAFEVAKQLDIQVCIARQNKHQYQLIDGFALKASDRVLVVDDITTTGGTAKQLLSLVNGAGATPVGVGIIATKGLFEVELGCPTHVLMTLEGMDAIAPEQCPLCQQQQPLSP